MQSGLDIRELLVLVIAEHPGLAVAFGDVGREKRDLSAAARSIHYEMRHGHAAGPASEFLDDADTDIDRSAEMANALRHVALEKLLGPYAHHEQLVIELH